MDRLVGVLTKAESLTTRRRDDTVQRFAEDLEVR
jgi:hypothetical protein